MRTHRGYTFSISAQTCAVVKALLGTVVLAAADIKDPTFLSTSMSDLRLGPKSQHPSRSCKDGQMIAVTFLSD